MVCWDVFKTLSCLKFDSIFHGGRSSLPLLPSFMSLDSTLCLHACLLPLAVLRIPKSASVPLLLTLCSVELISMNALVRKRSIVVLKSLEVRRERERLSCNAAADRGWEGAPGLHPGELVLDRKSLGMSESWILREGARGCPEEHWHSQGTEIKEPLLSAGTAAHPSEDTPVCLKEDWTQLWQGSQ